MASPVMGPTMVVYYDGLFTVISPSASSPTYRSSLRNQPLYPLIEQKARTIRPTRIALVCDQSYQNTAVFMIRGEAVPVDMAELARTTAAEVGTIPATEALVRGLEHDSTTRLPINRHQMRLDQPHALLRWDTRGIELFAVSQPDAASPFGQRWTVRVETHDLAYDDRALYSHTRQADEYSDMALARLVNTIFLRMRGISGLMLDCQTDQLARRLRTDGYFIPTLQIPDRAWVWATIGDDAVLAGARSIWPLPCG